MSNNYTLLCNNCDKNNALLSIKLSSSENSSPVIMIRCPCSGATQTISLNDYINGLKISTKKCDQVPIPHCKDHPNEIATHFCYKCQYHICLLCIEDDLSPHITHKNEFLNDYWLDIKNKKLDGAFSSLKSNFFLQIFEMKQKIIDMIDNNITKYQELIEQIEKSFQKNKKLNQDLFYLISILFENFELSKNYPNYYTITNLVKNTNLHTEISFHFEDKDSIEQKTEKFCFYLNNLFIVNTKIDYTKYKVKNTLIGHTSNLNKILPFKNNTLLSGSENGEIKLWDLNTFQALWTINAHQERINNIITLQSKNDSIIASCSSDKTIKFFSIDKQELLHTIDVNEEHIEPYSIYELPSKNQILSGIASYINGYDLDTYQCVITIKAKDSMILYIGELEYDNYSEKYSHMVSSFFNGYFTIWNYNTKQITNSIKASFSAIVGIIQLRNKKQILSLSYKKYIRVWSIPNLEMLNELIMPIGWCLSYCLLRDDTFATSDNHDTITFWKLSKEEQPSGIIFTLQDSSCIYCITELDDGRIITGNKDCTIKIWDD